MLRCLLLGPLLWTFLVCYPNPAVFVRNLLRYRHLPLDPGVAVRQHWELPEAPAAIEAFVDGLLVPASDWEVYRVPWYVPTAREAVETMQGDCETKTVLLASLLASRHIPFQIRASFNHIWVDYEGRPAQPGETADLAYLQGRDGKLGLRLPPATDWRTFYLVQKELLWQEMPPFRRLLWLGGLGWLLLISLGATVVLPRGDLQSTWRAPVFGDVVRASLAGTLALIGLLKLPPWAYGLPGRWTLGDQREALWLSALLGGLLVWLLSRYLVRRVISVAISPEALVVFARRGPSRRAVRLAAEEIRHLELESPDGHGQPWRVWAMRRTGVRALLLCYQHEVEARAAARTLGRGLAKPLVIRVEDGEVAVPAEEIDTPLVVRARHWPPHDLLPRPKEMDLEVVEEDATWTLRYPETSRGTRWVLLGFCFVPALLFGLITWLLGWSGDALVLWLAWVLAASLLGVMLYLLLTMREEMLARLSGARVEIGAGRLRYVRGEEPPVEVALDRLLGIEFGRKGDWPTVALVTEQGVLHLVGLCSEDERPWLRETIEEAVLAASRMAEPEEVR
jgi:hypothetical protein